MKPSWFARRSLCASAPSVMIALALSLGAAGCSEDETAPTGGSSSGTSGSSGASGSPDTTSSSSGSSGTSGTSGGTTTSKNDVDLTFTGDIDVTLKGKAGTCGGIEGGASFQVRSEELGVEPSFELAVAILGEEDWAKPPTVLNVKTGDKKSYVWKKTEGTVTAQRDRSRADFDVTLANVVGGGSVTVKGSIVCNE